MAINTQKVIVGGIAAGVVVGAIDFVVNGIVIAPVHGVHRDVPVESPRVG